MQLLDFSKALEIAPEYTGSEKKKTMILNDKKYLVKFPDPIREKNKDISYINNAFSEYVSSNIFRIIGFKTQNTILGKYKYNEKEKIVCACEDFTDDNHTLYEFENLALSTNPDKKIDTELSDIMDVIIENRMLNNDEVSKKFWDMFIVDALIGNTDRHNGNWGFLINKENRNIEFSPIYDCGSCLNPMYDDSDIQKTKDTEIKNIAINSYSCIKENGKKINYMTYIKQMKNEECNKAVKRVYSKIDINEINKFIDNIECMSVIRKKFYKQILEIRYNIIKDVYEKIVI